MTREDIPERRLRESERILRRQKNAVPDVRIKFHEVERESAAGNPTRQREKWMGMVVRAGERMMLGQDLPGKRTRGKDAILRLMSERIHSIAGRTGQRESVSVDRKAGCGRGVDDLDRWLFRGGRED